MRVAVFDAGFTNHTSLLGTDLPSSVTTYDWPGTGMGSSLHGTACAEIVYDMAPGATILPLAVELSGAALADRVDAINYAVTWNGTFDQVIINASWKTGTDDPGIRAACQGAFDGGEGRTGCRILNGVKYRQGRF